MKDIGRGAAFGAGFFAFGPALGGILLIAVVAIALFMVTHWWLLVLFPLCFVAGMLKALFFPPETEEQKAARAQREWLAQPHDVRHTVWHSGCDRCDERWPANALTHYCNIEARHPGTYTAKIEILRALRRRELGGNLIPPARTPSPQSQQYLREYLAYIHRKKHRRHNRVSDCPFC